MCKRSQRFALWGFPIRKSPGDNACYTTPRSFSQYYHVLHRSYQSRHSPYALDETFIRKFQKYECPNSIIEDTVGQFFAFDSPPQTALAICDCDSYCNLTVKIYFIRVTILNNAMHVLRHAPVWTLSGMWEFSVFYRILRFRKKRKNIFKTINEIIL